MTLHELETIKKDLIEEVRNLEGVVNNHELRLSSCIKNQLIELTKFYDEDLRINHVDVHNYYGLYVHVDCGFINEEGKIDFGSTFSLGLKSGHIVELNHGSMGPFSPINTYQVKRIRVLNKLLNDWDTVNTILAKEVFDDYLTDYKILKETRTSLEKCEESIILLKRDDILSTISVGSEIKYDESTPHYITNFDPRFTWEVFKIGNKFVHLRSPYGAEARISKDDIVEAINSKRIVIK